MKERTDIITNMITRFRMETMSTGHVRANTTETVSVIRMDMQATRMEMQLGIKMEMEAITKATTVLAITVEMESATTVSREMEEPMSIDSRCELIGVQ